MNEEVELEALIDYYMSSVHPGKSYNTFKFNNSGIVTIEDIN